MHYYYYYYLLNKHPSAGGTAAGVFISPDWALYSAGA